MTATFLLRFQEKLKNVRTAQICIGTKKHTSFRAEQSDSDLRHDTFRAVHICPESPARSLSFLFAGTQTITEIKQESGDNDPTRRQFETFPKVLLR